MSDTKGAPTWRRIFSVKDGHRFFIRHGDEKERLWIGDQSGRTPSWTDDGPMYVRTNAFLRPSEHGFDLPLCREDGEDCYTICNDVTAEWLIVNYGMKVEIRSLRLTCEQELKSCDRCKGKWVVDPQDLG